MFNWKKIAIKTVGLAAVLITSFFVGYGMETFIQDIS